MKVRYLGHSCLEFTSADGVKIITDPYTKVGYELPSGLTADILTLSHSHFDHCYSQAVIFRKLVTQTGAFLLNGVEIEGIPTYHDSQQGALRGNNIVYKITFDGITVCHLGDIGEECSPSLVEKIGKVDVLCVPVGGTYTVDALGAKKYADMLAPKAVIPMHYKPKDGALDITDAHPFLDLYEEKKITRIVNGETQIDGQTRGLIFMERVKA